MKKKVIKKHKIKIRLVLIFLLIFVVLLFTINYMKSLRIKNIYIVGNSILSDKEIIELAKIDSYPNFIRTSCRKIEDSLLKNSYIKEVEVSKSFLSVITIKVKENIPLFIKETDNKLVLSNGTEVNNDKNLIGFSLLINDVPDNIYTDLLNKFSLINYEIRMKVSEIKYDPNDYDTERFLLYMTDGNYVYINIDKFANLNYYDDIYPTLNNKKGTLYLDSGNHFVEFKK